MTEKENIENMRKCKNYEGCNIPLCPLDELMSERIELQEDSRCPMRGCRTKKTEGIRSARMRGISRFIPDKNRRIA